MFGKTQAEYENQQVSIRSATVVRCSVALVCMDKLVSCSSGVSIGKVFFNGCALHVGVWSVRCVDVLA